MRFSMLRTISIPQAVGPCWQRRAATRQRLDAANRVLLAEPWPRATRQIDEASTCLGRHLIAAGDPGLERGSWMCGIIISVTPIFVNAVAMLVKGGRRPLCAPVSDGYNIQRESMVPRSSSRAELLNITSHSRQPDPCRAFARPSRAYIPTVHTLVAAPVQPVQCSVRTALLPGLCDI